MESSYVHATGISPRNRLPRFICTIFFLLLFGESAALRAMADPEEVWLLVDTQNLTLAVMKGEAQLQKYDNIAIGSNGPSIDKLVSDETTPLGEFKISRINPRSRYRLFMEIDYPTMDHAQRALASGGIDSGEYTAVSEAWRGGQRPPQDTRLGGYLGIHGIGAGNSEIHESFNWTDGCVAVTNEQIDELARWVAIGTRVSIR
jgi:murein L,D-transpeptidase YafK